MLKTVISTGRAGVEKAAIDAAGKMQLSTQVRENRESNVLQSDGTLVLTWERPVGEALKSTQFATTQMKPLLIVDFLIEPRPETVHAWLKDRSIETLNIAGPTGEQAHALYQASFQFLEEVFSPARSF